MKHLFVYGVFPRISRGDNYCSARSARSAKCSYRSAPLENVLRPGMEREFWEEYGMWFHRRACESHNLEFNDCMLSGGTWVQGECCKQITKHDSRTPGLFKEEYKGTGAVALNSKTYVC